MAITCFALLPCGRIAAQGFTNLHSLVFTDGTGPVASLLLSGKTLYGTARTYGGGDAGGSGSVFKMGIDGSNFTNLHTFSGGVDGGNMTGDLVLVGGSLYTTATFGGGSNYGAVIKLSTNGAGLTNLYSFPVTSTNFPFPNNDGAYPFGGLVLSGGILYGTANGGGTAGWGAIFALNTNGSGFTNLHSFGLIDGQYPESDLILSDGTLYGVTPGGGDSRYGTIFAMNTNGTVFTNIYSFEPTSFDQPRTNDGGAFPSGSLLLSGDTLYGMAPEGGNAGNGTIYKINTNGSGFTVLHYFSATSGSLLTNSDGADPVANLILSGGILYGTAKSGGNFGNGTIFQVNTDGSGFATLYSFSATNAVNGTNADGAHPASGLILSGDTLYGTASEGGATGYGTVFSLLIPPTLTIQLSGTNAIVTWPTNFTGFNLQTATNLAPPVTWSALTGQNTVTNPVTGQARFFRLMHQ